MTKYLKKNLHDATKRIQTYMKKNKKLPSSVNMTDSEGKTKAVKIKEINAIYESRNTFAIKHNREPNYVSSYSSSANNALVRDIQDNSSTCCPTSLSMCIQVLFGWVSESDCAKALGTTKGSGTSPSQLINNAPKVGYKVSKISRTYKAVKECTDKGFPVIMHIQTKPATCLSYKNDYGHYIMCYKAKDNKFYVCDPTKGFKACASKTLINATNGRSLNFYKVEPY